MEADTPETMEPDTLEHGEPCTELGRSNFAEPQPQRPVEKMVLWSILDGTGSVRAVCARFNSGKASGTLFQRADKGSAPIGQDRANETDGREWLRCFSVSTVSLWY